MALIRAIHRAGERPTGFRVQPATEDAYYATADGIESFPPEKPVSILVYDDPDLFDRARADNSAALLPAIGTVARPRRRRHITGLTLAGFALLAAIGWGLAAAGWGAYLYERAQQSTTLIKR